MKWSGDEVGLVSGPRFGFCMHGRRLTAWRWLLSQTCLCSDAAEEDVPELPLSPFHPDSSFIYPSYFGLAEPRIREKLLLLIAELLRHSARRRQFFFFLSSFQSAFECTRLPTLTGVDDPLLNARRQLSRPNVGLRMLRGFASFFFAQKIRPKEFAYTIGPALTMRKFISNTQAERVERKNDTKVDRGFILNLEYLVDGWSWKPRQGKGRK